MEKYNWPEMTFGLWVAVAVVGGLLFVVGLFSFIQWIRFSWIRKDNSLHYTGRDLTQKLFNDEGIDKEIISSMWYAKYWNGNNRRKTYKLRPWTHDRRSIWTMMEASRQAYAEILRNKNKKAFWIAFRLPGIINFAGIILTIGLAYLGFNEIRGLATNEAITVKAWLYFGLALSTLTLAFSMSQIWQNWMLMKNVVPMLKNVGFTEEELRAIKSVFIVLFIYAILHTIWEVLKIAARISQEVSKR